MAIDEEMRLLEDMRDMAFKGLKGAGRGSKDEMIYYSIHNSTVALIYKHLAKVRSLAEERRKLEGC